MPKDQIVNTSEGKARVKPVKKLGDGVQSFTVKNPDGSTNTNRYRDGKMEDMNYNPKKMRKKKIRKKNYAKVPSKLKKVKEPSYTAPAVTLDKKSQAVSDARDRKKNKSIGKKIVDKVASIKVPKLKKGRKVRKTRNLVTGKTNKTRG
jgi:hypothetical protein